MTIRFVAFTLAALTLAGCSSLGQTLQTSANSSGLPGAALSLPNSSANVAYTVKVPTGSPAQSAGVSVNGGSATVFDLSPTSTGCTPAGGGKPLTCTVTLTVPVAADLFAMTTYSGPGGTGSVLTTANIYEKIAASGGTISTILGDTPAGVVLALQSGTSFECAPPSTIPLYQMVTDASGNIIVGSYGITVTLTDSDKTGTTGLTNTSLTSSSSAASLTYNGNLLKSAKVSASGPGITTVTNTVFKTTQMVYVTNEGGATGESVTAYASTANGNVAPKRTLAGSATTFSGVEGIALNSKCVLYVANAPAGSTGSILEFPAGGDGNISPIGSISGPKTGLGSFIEGMTFDKSGHLWVVNNDLYTIEEFAPNASGNATPIVVIGGSLTGLDSPDALTLDAAGNIYVTNYGSANDIEEFAKGSNGNVAPIATIAGANTLLDGPAGVAIDSTGKIYADNYNDSNMMIYAAGAHGNVAPLSTLPNAANIGLSILYTGGPVGDNSSALNFYVPNPPNGGSPIRQITGTKTNLVGCGYCSLTL